ncbi:MAG: hypothetical protein V4736_11275 [Bdellovibrionota bacterium]
MTKFLLLVTIFASFAANAGTNSCVYLSGSVAIDGIHRVSVNKDVMTVKKMGPNLSEIKGLGCAYKVSAANDETFKGYKVEQKLSGPCQSSIELKTGYMISIEKQRDQNASKANGLPTHHAQVYDIPLWATPCSALDNAK